MSLLAGVAAAGGGISITNMTALSLQLACFGFVFGALALAFAGTTGRKAIAAAGAGGFAVLAFLVNGLAPLVAGLDRLKYRSPFYWYDGNDPLTSGFDVGGIAVLVTTTVVLISIAVFGFRHRNVRACSKVLISANAVAPSRMERLHLALVSAVLIAWGPARRHPNQPGPSAEHGMSRR